MRRAKTVKRFVRQDEIETSTVARRDNPAAARGVTSMHKAEYL